MFIYVIWIWYKPYITSIIGICMPHVYVVYLWLKLMSASFRYFCMSHIHIYQMSSSKLSDPLPKSYSRRIKKIPNTLFLAAQSAV